MIKTNYERMKRLTTISAIELAQLQQIHICDLFQNMNVNNETTSSAAALPALNQTAIPQTPIRQSSSSMVMSESSLKADAAVLHSFSISEMKGGRPSAEDEANNAKKDGDDIISYRICGDPKDGQGYTLMSPVAEGKSYIDDDSVSECPYNYDDTEVLSDDSEHRIDTAEDSQEIPIDFDFGEINETEFSTLNDKLLGADGDDVMKSITSPKLDITAAMIRAVLDDTSVLTEYPKAMFIYQGTLLNTVETKLNKRRIEIEKFLYFPLNFFDKILIPSGSYSNLIHKNLFIGHSHLVFNFYSNLSMNQIVCSLTKKNNDEEDHDDVTDDRDIGLKSSRNGRKSSRKNARVDHDTSTPTTSTNKKKKGRQLGRAASCSTTGRITSSTPEYDYDANLDKGELLTYVVEMYPSSDWPTVEYPHFRTTLYHSAVRCDSRVWNVETITQWQKIIADYIEARYVGSGFAIEKFHAEQLECNVEVSVIPLNEAGEKLIDIPTSLAMLILMAILPSVVRLNNLIERDWRDNQLMSSLLQSYFIQPSFIRTFRNRIAYELMTGKATISIRDNGVLFPRDNWDVSRHCQLKSSTAGSLVGGSTLDVSRSSLPGIHTVVYHLEKRFDQAGMTYLGPAACPEALIEVAKLGKLGSKLLVTAQEIHYCIEANHNVKKVFLELNPAIAAALASKNFDAVSLEGIVPLSKCLANKY
jgi:hypothetical protein